ncbi:MAG: hypothetical protein ACHQIH_01755, partial [Ignavibacteria bacterium]
NILFPIGQSLYLKTGITIFKEINHDPYQTTPAAFYVNLFIMYQWKLSKFNLYAGGGFNLSLLSIDPKVFLRLDYALTRTLYAGIEISQFLVFGKQASKYAQLPLISVNFSIVL